MDPDYYQPVGPVKLVPSTKVRKGPNTVDAGVFPEVDQNDLAPQFLQG
jgi:hypothetical protein